MWRDVAICHATATCVKYVIYTCMYTCIYVYTNIYVDVYTHIYIHIYRSHVAHVAVAADRPVALHIAHVLHDSLMCDRVIRHLHMWYV